MENNHEKSKCGSRYAPLMLGLDLRRVQKDDEIYQIIACEAIIALNQDPLGVQAKRVCVYSFDK